MRASNGGKKTNKEIPFSFLFFSKLVRGEKRDRRRRIGPCGSVSFVVLAGCVCVCVCFVMGSVGWSSADLQGGGGGGGGEVGGGEARTMR